MIRLGGLDIPFEWLALAGAGLGIVLLLAVLHRAGRSARVAEQLAGQIGGLGQAVQVLAQGQDQLSGGLRSVSEAQASGQTQVLQAMEARLAQVQTQMSDRLHENALRSARSLANAGAHD